MKKKLFKVVIFIIAFLFIFIGFICAVYPFVSDWLNSKHMSRVISSYNDNVTNITEYDYTTLLNAVNEYNISLIHDSNRFVEKHQDHKLYKSLLNINNDIMGYIDIPKINVHLPIYHGTSEGVLQVAIGHLEGSSLPIGGESTHVVLSGHNGLSRATLFSYLYKLEIGDTFTIHVLNEILTYQVESINKVLPNENELIEIQEGRDLVTLVTCTPTGVNTHRLLVTASRIPTIEDTEIVEETIDQEVSYLYIILITFSIILILITIILIKHRKYKK